MDFAISFVQIILAFVSFYVAPTLSRRGIFFGVTVEPGFRSSPEGRGLLSRYRLAIAAVAVLILVIVGTLITQTTWKPRAVSFAGSAVQTVLGVAVWIQASNRAR